MKNLSSEFNLAGSLIRYHLAIEENIWRVGADSDQDEAAGHFIEPPAPYLHHRKLLPKLCRCAWDALMMFLHEVLDRKDVLPGGILVPQTFGGMANWNPHVHALITDTCRDREGNCYPMPEIDTTDIKVIEKLFADLVFKMLLEEGMISEELVENMNSWKHSGFSVYCGKPIKACDADGRTTLSEYISRAPFSLERMSFNEGSDTVLYRGEHFHPSLARNFDVAGPLEWIARITSHIPRKCAKQVISFIEQPFVIRRILKHLDLWKDPRPPPEPLELVCEPCADYVPWQDDVPEIEVG